MHLNCQPGRIFTRSRRANQFRRINVVSFAVDIFFLFFLLLFCIFRLVIHLVFTSRLSNTKTFFFICDVNSVCISLSVPLSALYARKMEFSFKIFSPTIFRESGGGGSLKIRACLALRIVVIPLGFFFCFFPVLCMYILFFALPVYVISYILFFFLFLFVFHKTFHYFIQQFFSFINFFFNYIWVGMVLGYIFRYVDLVVKWCLGVWVYDRCMLHADFISG